MKNTKNILVTGGAGYIGSHTCKTLAQAGYCPIAYDNLTYGHTWAVKWGPFEEGDIADRKRLDEVLKKYDPIAILHFAAFAYVGESVRNPAKYYKNNVVGTLSLLEAMRESQIGKIIFSSTCATYGIPCEVPITEDHPQNPINPYGSSKLMVEKILKDYDTAYGIKHINLRYFNAAGADPENEIGEVHDPETHLIPLAIDAANRISNDVNIFGTDYPTKDGTCIRDYIHVTDLADAHVKALDYLMTTNRSDSFNLGCGSGISVKDVIKAIRQVSNSDFMIIEAKRRDGDPPILISSSGKASELLKWRPKYSSIEIIVETAFKWQVQWNNANKFSQ